jgi:hypothetical protein
MKPLNHPKIKLKLHVDCNVFFVEVPPKASYRGPRFLPPVKGVGGDGGNGGNKVVRGLAG